MPNDCAVKMLPIGSIKPYDKNPRKNAAAVAAVAKSIKEFGFRQPIVVDKQMVVIVGHTRLKAAQFLEMAEVPAVVADMPEDKARAYRIADNKTASMSEWDDDLLIAELSALDDAGYDLEMTGFDEQELRGLLGDPAASEDEDSLPEEPEVAVTKPGDVIVLGGHRLMCGDSTIQASVDRLMCGQRASACFTSPPYNASELNIRGNKTTKQKYVSLVDNKPADEYCGFLSANMQCMLAVSDEVFYNIGLVQGNKVAIFRLVNAFSDKFKDVIYWKKSTAAPHIQPGVINNLVEFILCFGNGHRAFMHPQFSQGTYWNVIEGSNASGNEHSEIHKATFPVYLPENIITNFTPSGAIVVDCFGGTGTTMIACEKLARRCFMMEIEPIYCDVIIKRWEDFTGKKAERQNEVPTA